MFKDLTPTAVSKIYSLITGTAPFNQLTSGLASQQGSTPEVVYPNGANSPGVDYYTATNGGDTFHRVANLSANPPAAPLPNDYIVQGGSINGDGTGQVFATPYANETLPQLVFNGSGQLALANSGGTNSNDSQFFVTTGSPLNRSTAATRSSASSSPGRTSSDITQGRRRADSSARPRPTRSTSPRPRSRRPTPTA